MRSWFRSEGGKIFQRIDWLGFWLTSGLALMLYILTLPPEVTLEWSGVFSASAAYGGISPPPGFPLWTFYAWLFTKLVPFSNIAWRIALSSAVAGAFACGVLALMVSRGAATIFDASNAFQQIPEGEKSKLRVVCAAACGMGFAANNTFWDQAVIVETTALGCLLFSLLLCFLMCWSYQPERKRYLLAAVLVYGLNLSVSLLYAVIAPALALFVLLRRPSIGRDLFFALAILLEGILCTESLPLRTVYASVAVVSLSCCVAATLYTHQLLTHWRLLAASAMLLVLGLAPYALLPIISMTTPPANWGYPRTVEGFIHVLSRGQYEKLVPTSDISVFPSQISQYLVMTTESLGWLYVLPAIVPFYFIRRMGSSERIWMLGMLAVFLCLSLLVLAILNPPKDRQATELLAAFFVASHLVLTLWTGYGLVLIGVASRTKPSLG